MSIHAKDLIYAAKARRYLSGWTLVAIQEARRAGIPISLGLAMLEQESGGRNVFGHDPTIFVGAGRVTKKKYLAYKKARGHTRMQGVGPLQLTWWEFQDAADRRGGCWKGRINIRVGFEHLAALIKQYGEAEGIKRYNGNGPAADAYSRSVRAKADAWHRRLAD